MVASGIRFFFGQGGDLLVIVGRVPRRFARLLCYLLYLIAVGDGRDVSVVWYVRRGVEVRLILRIFRFHFHLLSLHFCRPLFHLAPARTNAGNHARSNGGGRRPRVPHVGCPAKQGVAYGLEEQEDTCAFRGCVGGRARAGCRRNVTRGVLARFIHRRVTKGRARMVSVRSGGVTREGAAVPRRLNRVRTTSAIRRCGQGTGGRRPASGVSARFRGASL